MEGIGREEVERYDVSDPKGLEDSKLRQDLGVILDPGFFETS